MKKYIMIIAILFAVMLCGCKNTSSPSQEHSSEESKNITALVDNTSFPGIIEARQAVIDKWKSSNKAFECAKFIEDVYKQYYSDDTISNIYYYCMAKYQYDNYLEHPDYDGYYEELKSATLLIDPNYKGELSDEIQAFVAEIFPDGIPYDEHSDATSRRNNYDTMTNAEKKKICEYIQGRYDYYDALESKPTGDKYSDQIWEEVMEQYGLEEWQVTLIWSNGYSY